MIIHSTQQARDWCSKALKINRLVPLFLFFILYLPVLSQSKRAYRAENRPIKQVLNDLEKQYEVYFSFNPDELRNVRVSITTSSNDIDGLLGTMLSRTDLVSEKIKDKFYVIKKPESKFLDLLVTDNESDSPLSYATVRLKGTPFGQVTGLDGKIRLVIPKPKSAVLEVSFLGFQTTEINVTDIESKTLFKVALRPEPMDLNDFEVKEYINVGIGSDPKANSFRILPQKMEILPGLSERDVLLSAQIISGLASNDESASGINIRGSAPDNTLLYWNNIPVYHTAHYFGSISSFIPSSVGSLDIYKNYIPVRYGGATAGLISIFSRNEIDAQTKAEASINMTHADAYFKVPFKKDMGSVMLAFRRSYNDAIPTWTFNSYGTKLFGNTISDSQGVFQITEDENDFENDLSFSDINLKWNYEASGRSSFESSFVRSSSNFNYNENDEEAGLNIQQRHNIRSLGANVGWSYRVNDDYSLKSSLSYSSYDMSYAFNNLRNLIINDDDDQTERSNYLSNLELRVSNKWRKNDRSVLEFGYQLNHYIVENRISESDFFEEDEVTDIQSNGLVNAVFIDYNYRPTDRLEAVLSGRLTHVGTLRETFFSPQIKLNYNATKDIILKSTFGIYHQYLSTIRESEFTLSNAVEQHWLLADLNDDEEEISTVPIIFNSQVTLGAIYNANSWLFDLDFYIKNIEGILAINQGFGFENDQAFEPGFERLIGIDLTIRKRWKSFKTWFSYNFQDSEVELESIFTDPFPSSFNIRHQFRLSNTYNWKNWEFSLGYIFKTGLPFTQVTNLTLLNDDGEEVDPDDEDDDTFYDIEYTSPNGRRISNYHRVDLSVWHKLGAKNQRIRGEIGLSFINLLNRNNTFNRTYSIDFDRNDEIAIIERKKFFLNFTPNLSLRFWF